MNEEEAKRRRAFARALAEARLEMERAINGIRVQRELVIRDMSLQTLVPLVLRLAEGQEGQFESVIQSIDAQLSQIEQ